jgi:hypothetical protein
VCPRRARPFDVSLRRGVPTGQRCGTGSARSRENVGGSAIGGCTSCSGRAFTQIANGSIGSTRRTASPSGAVGGVAACLTGSHDWPPRRESTSDGSLDFVLDVLDDGRRFRLLTVVDDFTRAWLAIEVDTSLGGRRVVQVLQRVLDAQDTDGARYRQRAVHQSRARRLGLPATASNCISSSQGKLLA